LLRYSRNSPLFMAPEVYYRVHNGSVLPQLPVPTGWDVAWAPEPVYSKGKGGVVPVLSWASRHEGVLGQWRCGSALS
jgi:hypothetical protein